MSKHITNWEGVAEAGEEYILLLPAETAHLPETAEGRITAEGLHLDALGLVFEGVPSEDLAASNGVCEIVRVGADRKAVSLCTVRMTLAA